MKSKRRSLPVAVVQLILVRSLPPCREVKAIKRQTDATLDGDGTKKGALSYWFGAIKMPPLRHFPVAE